MLDAAYDEMSLLNDTLDALTESTIGSATLNAMANDSTLDDPLSSVGLDSFYIGSDILQVRPHCPDRGALSCYVF